MADVSTRTKKMRSEVRDKISASHHLRKINEYLDDESLSIERLPIAKLKMDGHFRLLAKVLPDLKNLEVSGGLTHQTHEDWLGELE